MEIDCEVREKSTDLVLPHLFRMPFIVKENEALDPIYVSVFSFETVVFDSRDRADLIEPFR
jgi:hypothetical protein